MDPWYRRLNEHKVVLQGLKWFQAAICICRFEVTTYFHFKFWKYSFQTLKPMQYCRIILVMDALDKDRTAERISWSLYGIHIENTFVRSFFRLHCQTRLCTYLVGSFNLIAHIDGIFRVLVPVGTESLARVCVSSQKRTDIIWANRMF